MYTVRCTICRLRLPTLKTLKSHYLTKHSKFQIVKELMRTSILCSSSHSLTKSTKLKPSTYNTIYLHENVQITYSDDTIVVDDESNTNNLIELSVKDLQIPLTATQEDTNCGIFMSTSSDKKKKAKKNRKSKKFFHIGIKKIAQNSKSLQEHTGEFYECHCMEKTTEKMFSQSDSCADFGKMYCCMSCGNKYPTLAELQQHETVHNFQCKLCSQIITLHNYKEHVQQHILRVYCCHLCGIEFICKEILATHLGHHFEQQTFETVLDMERDYNMYGFCNTRFSSGDYTANINNILFFLLYPYDHYYSRNLFRKVICDICFQEFQEYDYERHMKSAHCSS